MVKQELGLTLNCGRFWPARKPMQQSVSRERETDASWEWRGREMPPWNVLRLFLPHVVGASYPLTCVPLDKCIGFCSMCVCVRVSMCVLIVSSHSSQNARLMVLFYYPHTCPSLLLLLKFYWTIKSTCLGTTDKMMKIAGYKKNELCWSLTPLGLLPIWVQSVNYEMQMIGQQILVKSQFGEQRGLLGSCEDQGGSITWIWKERLKWETKAEPDSQFCLETGLYLAFYCAMICENGSVDTLLQQETNAGKVNLSRGIRHWCVSHFPYLLGFI